MPKTNVTIKISPISEDAPGFLPRYRQLLAAKRSFTNFDNAEPEDIDEAYRLLMDHITEPKAAADKRRELDKLTANQVMDIFNTLMGVKTVPPANDAG